MIHSMSSKHLVLLITLTLVAAGCNEGKGVDRGDDAGADCPAGTTECAGYCVDTLTDNANCGGCDDGGGSNTCVGDQVCDGSGACVADCMPGLTDCHGFCTDTDIDPSHCGACDDGSGALACAPADVCFDAGCVDPSVPVVFTATDDRHDLKIPLGVTQIQVTADGARGGDGWNVDVDLATGLRGLGGRVVATLDVTEGEVLFLHVGGAGEDAADGAPGIGGYNGGGDGETSPWGYAGGGGGGATDIRRGGDTLADRVLVAGGGGSGSGWCTAGTGNGGDGGDLVGETGEMCSSIAPGTGGSQVTGGSTGGDLGVGGTPPTGQGGAAGGGGYYGGGASDGSGGGGGSSYVVSPGSSDVTHTAGVVDGDGTLDLVFTL